MKPTDIINRKLLKEHLDMVCGNNTPWGKAQQAYIECFKGFIDHEPSIDQSEAVKVIWAAQIDDLIAKIKAASLGKWYVGRIDGKSEDVIPTDAVVKILENAK